MLGMRAHVQVKIEGLGEKSIRFGAGKSRSCGTYIIWCRECNDVKIDIMVMNIIINMLTIGIQHLTIHEDPRLPKNPNDLLPFFYFKYPPKRSSTPLPSSRTSIPTGTPQEFPRIHMYPFPSVLHSGLLPTSRRLDSPLPHLSLSRGPPRISHEFKNSYKLSPSFHHSHIFPDSD